MTAPAWLADTAKPLSSIDYPRGVSDVPRSTRALAGLVSEAAGEIAGARAPQRTTDRAGRCGAAPATGVLDGDQLIKAVRAGTNGARGSPQGSNLIG